MSSRALISAALAAFIAGSAAAAADVCLPPEAGVGAAATAPLLAPARERKPVGPKLPYTEPMMRVTVEFRPPAEIVAKQREQEYREDYDAAALAFYVNANLGMVWLPDDGTASLDVLFHEFCHLQEDPTKPGFLKDHDDTGRWHHTGRKDVC